MIKIKNLTYYLFALLLVFQACDDDDLDDGSYYDDGIFIVNEGVFGGASASLSFKPFGEDTIVQDVFSVVNDIPLGDVAQSMTFYDDRAYIVMNNNGKVIVVQEESLAYLGEITGLVLPRYLLGIEEGKAYVTQWGADGINGSVAVVDLNTLQITKTIAVGKGAEQMIRLGNYIYVANSGGFDRENTVSVIDIATDEVIQNIEVGDNPNSLVLDRDNNLWVLNGGYSDWTNPSNNTPPSLSHIYTSSNTVNNSIGFEGGFAADLQVDDTGSQLYFLDNQFGGNIIQHHIDSLSVDVSTPFIAGAFYSVNRIESSLWVGDAKDYSSNGEVIEYSLGGVEQGRYTVGITPTFVVKE